MAKGHQLRILLVSAACALCVVRGDGPLRLIIDTDMSTDCDDVGALCITHAMMNAGEVDLVAVVHNSGLPQGIGAVSVINHYYGRDDIPLGAYKGDFDSDLPGRRSEGWRTRTREGER